MLRYKTASGREQQSAALIETQLPISYDAALNSGARVLGSDGRVYESIRDSTGQYVWKARAQGPNLSRIDVSTAGTIYAGTAPFGTDETAAAWIIVKAVFNAAGLRTSKGSAVNIAWSARSTATYS